MQIYLEQGRVVIELTPNEFSAFTAMFDNCNEDSSDNYKKIVGNGNCNLAFIVQSGGSTEWSSASDCETCVAGSNDFV